MIPSFTSSNPPPMPQNIELHFHPKNKKKNPQMHKQWSRLPVLLLSGASCNSSSRSSYTQQKNKKKLHKTKQRQQQQATTYPTGNATNNKKKTPAESTSKCNCSEFMRILRSGRRGIRRARRKTRAVAQPQ